MQDKHFLKNSISFNEKTLNKLSIEENYLDIKMKLSNNHRITTESITGRKK